MKALIISIVLLGITYMTLAQQIPFKGVGELKVGETHISFIDSFKSKSKRQVKQINKYLPTDDTKYNKFIIEYTKTADGCLTANNPIIPEHRTFVIYDYHILDQYHSPRVQLEFFRDTLYQFSVTEPQFVEDFKTKYGQPAVDEILHSPGCKVDGADISFEDKDMIENWNSQNILAANKIISTRSPECEKVLKTIFSVTNVDTKRTVELLEHEAFKRCQDIRYSKSEISDKF